MNSGQFSQYNDPRFEPDSLSFLTLITKRQCRIPFRVRVRAGGQSFVHDS